MGLPVCLDSAYNNLNKIFMKRKPKTFNEPEIKGATSAEIGTSQMGKSPRLKGLV